MQPLGQENFKGRYLASIISEYLNASVESETTVSQATRNSLYSLKFLKFSMNSSQKLLKNFSKTCRNYTLFEGDLETG